MNSDGAAWIARENRLERLEPVEPESNPDRAFLDCLLSGAPNAAPAVVALPTAVAGIFDNAAAAREYVRQRGAPIVVKADGLAAGKGAIVCPTVQEAVDTVKRIMEDRVFGDAGSRVVIEEFLTGEEASFLAFTDGETVLPMASTQDHKAVFDDDKGPNTGGMGAYSPVPILDESTATRVLDTVIAPVVTRLGVAVISMSRAWRPDAGR